MNTNTGKQLHVSRHSNGQPNLRRKLLPASLFSLLGLFACGGEAWAGGHVAANATPIGGTVVGGSGSISQSGANTTVVQNSQLLALNWQSFNVGSNASVLFKQPSFTSVALNRILDQNPSQIFGHVNANGQIFLINTHGIIFGAGSQMNVGGLVASTLDLTPSDFLKNHFNLDAHGSSAGVVNHGTIEAASGGSVALIGGQVENDGLIVANYGHINLDGADRAVLDFDGEGLINVQVTGELQKRLNTDEAAVANKGKLQADSGTVVLQASAAKDLFTNLVNNTGVVSAGGISTHGGKVQLIASGGNTVTSGTIDVSGTEGGTVEVLSDQNVGVTGNINASGTQGGGSIRVGGGYQGGEGLQTANATYVAPNATLNADATQIGNGGSVVVWGNQVNNFYGSISARGGALGGNGGEVETSSHYGLNADGTVDASAAHGKAGTWLLDPYDVTINSGSTTSGATTSGSTYTANASGSTIGNGVINTALTGGTNVFVFTNNSQASNGTENGDITVSAPITASGAGSLYLEAAGSILVNSNIASDGTHALNVNLWADYSGTAAGTTYSRGTSCGSSTNCVVKLTGASITTSGGNVDIETDGAVTLTSASSISTAGSNVTIGGTTANAVNSLTVSSTSSIDTTGGSGNLAVIANSGISAAGALKVSGTTALAAGAGAISASNAGNDFVGTVALSNSGPNNVTLNNNGNALQLGNVTVGTGSVNLLGTGITQASGTSITQAAGTGVILFNAGFAPITLTNSGNNFAGQVALVNGGNNDVALSNGSNALQIGFVSVGTGALTLSGVGITQASSSITQAAGAGTATFNAGAGVISLASSGNNFTGSVALSNSGPNNVTLNNNGNALQLGNVTVGTGSVNLFGAGITQASGTSITQAAGTGVILFNAGLAPITLTNSGNDFAGQVALVNGGNNDVALSNGSNALQVGFVSVGTGALTLSGVGIAQASSSITQAAGAGTATFNAGAGVISLANSGNNFTGSVALSNSGANNVSVNNGTNLLTLDNVSVGTGTLTLSGAGLAQESFTSIAQSAGGGAVTLNGGAGAITLGNSNNFTGSVGISNSGANDVNLNNGSNPLSLGSVAVGGALAVSSNAIHLTQNINSNGTQTYQGPVTLNADATLTDSSGSGVVFQSTVDGGHNLAVSTTGTTSFGQNVGGLTNLASLSVGTGGITLNSSVHSIVTTGSQNYGGQVTIGHSTTLQGTTVNLNAGVSGGSHSLTITGNASLGGTSSALSSLSVSGTTQLAGTVSTSGTQTYTGAVTLTSNSTLNSTGSGGAITFDSTLDGNYSLGVTSSSNSIAFNGPVGGAASLVSLTAHGSSGITLGGNVTTSGTQSYTGALTLNNASTTLTGNTVTLNNTINQSSQALTITGNAVLSGTSTDRLSAFSVSGTTTLDGNISTSGTQSYAGLVTLGSSVASLTGSNIVLGNGASGGSTSGVTLNGNATLGGSSSLSGLTVTGTTLLQGNVTTSGTQTYSGAVSLGSNVTLDSTGSDINFSNTVDNNTTTPELLIADAPSGAVNFNAAVGSNATSGALAGLTTQSSTFSDTSTLKIGAGGLSITTNGGDITQGGAFTVAGASIFNAGGNAITLTSGNAFTGAVSLSNSGANDVSLTNSGMLTLGNVDVGSGALTLIGAGIMQSGGHIVQASGAGTASFNAGSNALTLNGATNNFTGAVDLTGANTQIASGSALNLGTSTISGTLAVSNNGAVSQSGALNVTGAANFTQTNGIAGSGQDIVLNNAGNDFKSTVTFAASGTNAQIHSLSLTNTDATPSLALPTSITGNLTLDYTAAALALPAVQVGGNLSATSNAGITQSGVLSVTGTSTLNSGSNAITLNNTSNSFTGAVHFNGGNTQIDSGSALNLGAGSINGTLAVSNAGTISQSGALTVTGAASFTQNGVGADVLLNVSNDFQNTVTIAGTGINNLSLTNIDLTSNAPSLPASITGNLTLNYGATTGLTLPATAVGGTLDVTAANGITISGNETTGGGQSYHSAVTLSADATLQSSGIGAVDFAANVTGPSNTLTLLTGGAVTFGGTTQLGGLTSTSSTFTSNALNIVNGGNLSITTTGGAITQTGAFSVAGTSTFNAGSQSITLTNSGNIFTGAVSLTGGTTTISQSSALTLGTLSTGTLTVTSHGALNLGGGTVNGVLTANSNSNAITQSGALTVTGTSGINAGSNSITLTDANHFVGAVALTGGATQITNGATQLTLGTLNTGALTATSGAGLNLGSGTVGGPLTAFGGGSISQNGALTVNGAATITQNGSGQDVLLANTGNQFKNTVTFAGTQIRDLSFANAYATSSSGLTLPASINGNLTLVYPNAGLALPGTTVGGTLSVTANGISVNGSETTGGGQTYNGAVTLGNDATLHSNGNGDINFASTVNGAYALTLSTSGNVTLGGPATLNGLASTSNTFSGNALTIGGGGLSITTTGGAITQTGEFTVTGGSTFNAGGNAITLINGGNSFAGAVALTGGTTQISQSSALTLGAVHTGSLTVSSQGDLNLGSGSVGGDLSATSNGGAISESGALSVSGSSSLNAGTAAITLTSAGNAFGGAVNLIGGATQIADSTALSLGTLNTGDLTAASSGNLNLGSGAIGGNLVAISNGGAISQTGALSVAGTTALNGGNGAISLTDSGNTFTGAVTATGAGVALNDAGDLTVASLTDNANGSVALTAGGTLTAYGISAGSGDITLASNGGTLSTGGAVSGGNISLTGQNGITSTNSITASGSLMMTSANGGITSAGGLSAGTLTGSSAGATAFNGTNTIGTLGSFSANGFSLSNGQSLTVIGPVAGSGSTTLTITSGDLALDGLVSGTSTALNAAGNINEGSGGGIVANTLSGGVGGAVSLSSSANQVVALGNFSASHFTLLDGPALAINGTVNGGTSTAITVSNGGLTIKGAVLGATTTLDAAGAINENGGSITASTLSGGASGAATLNGNNQVGALGNFSANGFSLNDGQALTVNGSVNGNGSTSLTTTSGGIAINGTLIGSTVALNSAGSISEGSNGIQAGTLTGSSIGVTTLSGANQVGTLGAFTANGFSLTDAQALTVSGAISGGSSLALTTTSGGIVLNNTVSGTATSLNAAGTLSEGVDGSIAAATLSGNAGGVTTLTGLNKVGTLGDFRSLAGFNFADDQTLTLSSLNGSSYVVDAGTSTASISVTHGNLYQADHTWTYDGTGYWSSTGAIGTQANPIYVMGTTTQYVPLVGTPPAYFYAVDRFGDILSIVGDSVNVPTSLFSSRAQNVNNHLDSYIDASVITANYRSFGIVPSGILLPPDQQSCQTSGGTDCADE